jgi:hypothetical protein
MGATMPVFTLAVQNAFPKQRLGEVTAGTQLFRNVGGTVGTAILGGVLNTRLVMEIEKLQDEPFLAQVKDNPSIPGNHSGSTLIQEVLNPSVQTAIREKLSSTTGASSTVITDFDRFVHSSKLAFSNAVDYVFIVGASLMVIAFFVVLLLPEIPLRKSDKSALENEGQILQDEFGQHD